MCCTRAAYNRLVLRLSQTHFAMGNFGKSRPLARQRWRGVFQSFLCLILLALAGCSLTPSNHRQLPNIRVEALALLQTLNADLLSHHSATRTLEHWCDIHKMAMPARIIARRMRDAAKPIPDELRARLAVAGDEKIAYRHVLLACGNHVLSEADNWYVRDRLTDAMNRRLDTSDVPFGKVVQALGFWRQTLDAQLLWSPMSANWEMSPQFGSQNPAVPMSIPRFVLRHEAILFTAKRVPFSAVVETYTNAVFDFGQWAAYRELP